MSDVERLFCLICDLEVYASLVEEGKTRGGLDFYKYLTRSRAATPAPVGDQRGRTDGCLSVLAQYSSRSIHFHNFRLEYRLERQ